MDKDALQTALEAVETWYCETGSFTFEDIPSARSAEQFSESIAQLLEDGTLQFETDQFGKSFLVAIND